MRMSKEEIAKLAGCKVSELVVAKNRNTEHGLTADTKANGKKLALGCLGDILAAYNKLERLADNKVSRGGETFGVALSETRIQWLEDKCAGMHGKVFDSLRNGERVKAVVDSMPE